MLISNYTIGWILAIAGSFGVNYAQIQVNSSSIEHSEQQNQERYDNIKQQLDSIEQFLRNNHEHSETHEH